MVQNLNVTFDGVSDVARLPGQSDVEWFSKFIGYYSVYHDGTDFFRANADLTGDGWTIKTLRFNGAGSNKTTVTDLDNGAGRRIDFLELGFNSDVDLISTRARYIFGWDGDKHEVKLGNQQDGSTFSINLYADENIVTTGNAYVHHIGTGGPETSAIGDVIKIGSGGAAQVQTGHGDDRVTGTTGACGRGSRPATGGMSSRPARDMWSSSRPATAMTRLSWASAGPRRSRPAMARTW